MYSLNTFCTDNPGTIQGSGKSQKTKVLKSLGGKQEKQWADMLVKTAVQYLTAMQGSTVLMVDEQHIRWNGQKRLL